MGVGLVLIENGLITQSDLDRALREQSSTGDRLDRVLVRMGVVTRDQVLNAVGSQFGMPVVDLSATAVERDVLGALPNRLVYKQRCVPIAKDGQTLTVATCDPFELSAMDELRLLTGSAIRLVLADEQDLTDFIREHYGVGGDTLDELAGDDPQAATTEDTQDDEALAQEASVVRLVNDLLAEAIEERATDVHIEPYEHGLDVRYRVDGVLSRANVHATIHRFASAIVSRFKIMASLDVAEKRRPQDGRITFRHRRRSGRREEFDLRLSIIPMLHGEGVVLRVLNKSAVMLGLPELGMPDRVLTRWATQIERPHGILLVTGPTGSGKSTTLYASLARIASERVKVITVEDPVEYHVEGVNQIQVNPAVGLTFASGLRSILRHDPDAIMIGEIRDRETAEVAVQASLTGHLVLSTLHTNNAASAATRLLDMGIEPFLVASSLEGVIAQRLVRRVCPECSAPHTPTQAELPPGVQLRPGATLRQGTGCRECRNTGYRGRVGLYEMLTISDDLRSLITRNVSAGDIAAAARASGDLHALRDDGIEKLLAGKTSLEEVTRAITI